MQVEPELFFCERSVPDVKLLVFFAVIVRSIAALYMVYVACGQRVQRSCVLGQLCYIAFVCELIV